MKNKIWFFIAFVLVFAAWTWGIKQIITPKDPTLNFSKEQVFPLQLDEEKERNSAPEGAPKISGAHFLARTSYSSQSSCYLDHLFIKEEKEPQLGELALQHIKKHLGKDKSTYEVQLPEEWAKKYSINITYLQWEGEAISFENLSEGTDILFLENGTSLDKKDTKQFFFGEGDQDMMIAVLNKDKERIYIPALPQKENFDSIRLEPWVITVFIIQKKAQLFFKSILDYGADYQFTNTFRTQRIYNMCKKIASDNHPQIKDTIFWPNSHIKITLPTTLTEANITESQLIHFHQGDLPITQLETYTKESTPLFSLEIELLDWMKEKTGKVVKKYQATPIKPSKSEAGLTRDLEKLETGYYALLFKDSNNFLYSIPLEVISDFSVKTKDDKKRMIYYIENKLSLLDKNLTGQLDQILGTGNYSYHFERSIREEDNSDDYHEYYYYDDEYDYYDNYEIDKRLLSEEKTLAIEYFINPQQHYTGTLVLENIAQEKTSYPLDFFVESIPQKRISFDLFSQDINILPSQGYWGDKIKIWSKNIETFSIYGQSCQRKQEKTFDTAKMISLIWEKKKNNGRFPKELYYRECNGEIKEHQIKNENFSYWKRTDHERTLPEELKSSSYFRLSNKKNMEDAKFYTRSPFGIFAKVVPEREIKIWALNFKDGSSVKDGHIIISNQKNEVLLDQPFDKEILSFPLPEWKDDEYQIFIKNNEGENHLILEINDDGYWFASRLNRDQTEQNTKWHRKDSSLRIYGYTDRSLYREGDTVQFAGFIQDIQSLVDNTKAVPEGSVNISIKKYNWGRGGKHTLKLELDEFWGFQGSLPLKKGEFWEFGVSYNFIPAGDEDREYSRTNHHSSLYVEDFQKKSFQLNSKKIEKDNNTYLIFSPEYYFGGKLKNYDISLEYSAREKSGCEDCRWRDSEFYYNYLFDDYSYYYGEIEETGYSGNYVLGIDKNMDLLKGKKFNLRVRTTIKDRLSNESRVDIEDFEFLPEAEIGLDGYPYEWMYQEENKNNRIKGELKDPKKSKELSYEWYYRPFDFKQERDIQGTYYYVYGDAFLPLQSGSLNIVKNFSLVPPLKEGGEYFLKIISKDKNGEINGEVHKMLTYYDKVFKGGFQGNIENSYRLKVDIDKKHYQPGSSVPVHISPYIKWAKILITVEQSNNILYHEMKELDGSLIQIPVQEKFFPSSEVSVIQFVGEDINSQLGKSGEQQRTEPSFFAGYATLGIQEDIKTITTTIHTDKKEYLPWENITINLETKDYQGKPIDAKVSLAVVDKALSDIYDSIKDPIADIHYKVGSSIVNYGNWKNLYYALRTIFRGGEKGWDGGQGVKNIRKKFYDLAFWKPDIYTKGGKASVSFTLPDNLTTWIIDTVSFADQIKLGAQRAEFKVSQDFLLEANIPAYLTLGDEIILPIKVVGNEKKIKKQPILFKAQLKQEDGTIQELWTQDLKLNEQAKISFKVSDDVLNDSNISIILEAKMGNYQDAIEQKIPIRTEGLVMMQRDFNNQKEGSSVFNFEGKVKKANLNIQLSQLPLESLFSSFKRIIGFKNEYSLYLIQETQMLLLLQELRGQDFFEKKMNDPTSIILENGETLILADKVQQNLEQLSNRMRYDGRIRPRRHQRLRNEESYPFLDIQLYGLLVYAEKQGITLPKDLLWIKKRIQKIWTENSYLRLLSQWMDSKYGPKEAISAPFKSSINTGKNDLAYQIFEFSILAQQGKKNEAKKRLPQVISLLDAGLSNAQHFESELFNLKSLQAILLDGLISLQPQFWGNALEDQRSLQLIQEFLKLRDTRNLRGYDNFTNGLILQSLSKAFAYYKDNYSAENIDCSFLINQERFPLKSHTSLEQEFSIDSNAQSISVERSCLHPVFIDLESKYLLQDSSKNKNILEGLKELQLSVVEKEKSEIGDILTLQGNFQAEKNLGNTTIELFIPASIKLLEVKNNDEYGDERKKLNINNWECYPDHYEFRYDRVILYYNSLKAGVACEVSLPWVKSYEGNFTTMPSRLYETNGGDSRGRTNVLWKYITQGKGKINF